MAACASNPELGEVYGHEQRKNEQLRSVLKQDLEAVLTDPTVPGRPVSGHGPSAMRRLPEREWAVASSERPPAAAPLAASFGRRSTGVPGMSFHASFFSSIGSPA